MHIQGLEHLRRLATEPHLSIKAVLNTNGIIFFPASQEHRDQSGPGISYADNYKGNALAAMISPGKIEVRYHRDYTDAQVAEILTNLLAHDSCAFLCPIQATYQGRPLQLIHGGDSEPHVDGN